MGRGTGSGTQSRSLVVSLSEVGSLPYRGYVPPLATAGPSIWGKVWAPVGGWGTYIPISIISYVNRTNESSLGKGIGKDPTATLKIRQAPGVP